MNIPEKFASYPTELFRVWIRRKGANEEYAPTETYYVYKENADCYVRNQFPTDSGFWEAEVRSEPYNQALFGGAS